MAWQCRACKDCSPASIHCSVTISNSSCGTAPEPCCCERAAMSRTRLRAASALGRLPGWRSCCRASCSALQSRATASAAACHLHGHVSHKIWPPEICAACGIHFADLVKSLEQCSEYRLHMTSARPRCAGYMGEAHADTPAYLLHGDLHSHLPDVGQHGQPHSSAPLRPARPEVAVHRGLRMLQVKRLALQRCGRVQLSVQGQRPNHA